VLQLAFPYAERFPAHCPQIAKVDLISFDVLQELWLPIVAAGLGDSALVAALMQVPKAAMHKDHLAQLCEYQVRLSRKRWNVKPITKALRVKKPPNKHFRRSILARNAPHVLRSPLRSQPVCHDLA
jgi:hypothetical protein